VITSIQERPGVDSLYPCSEEYGGQCISCWRLKHATQQCKLGKQLYPDTVENYAKSEAGQAEAQGGGVIVQRNALLTDYEEKVLPDDFIASVKKKSLTSKVYQFHKRQVWQAYGGYLEGSQNFYPLGCLTKGKSWHCGEGDHDLWRGMPCGDRDHCILCGEKYAREKAKVAMSIFSQISDAWRTLHGRYLHLARVVFTLPESVQAKVTFSGFSEIDRLVYDTYQEYFGDLPAGEVTNQFWHTEKPLKGWYPHVHCSFINLVYDKESQEFKEVRPYIDEEEFKIIWGRKLAKKFGLAYRERVEEVSGKRRGQIWENGRWKKLDLRFAGFKPINDKPFANREGVKMPFTNKAYLRGRLKYDFRRPQIDIADYGDRAGLAEFSPGDADKINYLLHPPKRFARERWFGWLADGVRQKYCSLLGITVEKAKDRKERQGAEVEENQKEVMCPVHGCTCLLNRDHQGEPIIRPFWQLQVKDIILYPGGYWEVSPEAVQGWSSVERPERAPPKVKVSGQLRFLQEQGVA